MKSEILWNHKKHNQHAKNIALIIRLFSLYIKILDKQEIYK